MKTRNHLGSCQEHSSNPKGMPALCYFTALELSSLYLNRTMLPILGSCPSNVLQWHTGLHHSSATVQLPGQPPTPSMSFERSAALRLLVVDVSPAPTVRPETCEALSLHACLVAPVMSDSLRPCGPQPSRLLCPWDSPGRNTAVGCHFFPQGIFPTQRSWPGDGMWISCIAGRFFTIWATREAQALSHCIPNLLNESSGNMTPLYLSSDWNSSVASHYKSRGSRVFFK